MKRLYLVIGLTTTLLILSGHYIQAQDSTLVEKDSGLSKKDSTLPKNKPASPSRHSYFEGGLNYQSNNVYLGRKDSVVMPYVIPMLSYYHKSGLYFTVSAAYLKTATDNRIDLVTMEGGYSFHAGKYSGDFTASKFFYSNQSTTVTSGITAALSYQNGYNLGFIKPVFTATLDFGSQPDFEGSFGLEHTFETLHDNLDITPSFVANASTLNYYNNYFKERKFKKKNGSKTITGTQKITGTVLNASAFRIMDYEASLPISYTAGRFTFNFTPTYAIPEHAAEVQIKTVYSTGQSTTKLTKENLQNSFFYTLGITYQF
jgi:hypothetical protein